MVAPQSVAHTANLVPGRSYGRQTIPTLDKKHIDQRCTQSGLELHTGVLEANR